MNTTLAIIGVGPGDPELLTVKAIRAVEKSSIIVTPKAKKNGNSTALSILEQGMDLAGKETLELHFPMKKICLGEPPDAEVETAWRAAADAVLQHLDNGRNVVFPTLGDPAIYSTGYYLYQTIIEMRPEVEVNFTPGISAMSACSASTRQPICLGDDKLAVIPATFTPERLEEILSSFDTIVLMKVHTVIDELRSLLDRLDLIHCSVLIERAGMADERIIGNLDEITGPLHYFSTIVVRKKSL
ncbi:MAG: precorrin-2 C(20)-methyltransferase [Thermodesulfobacteriota bacterium]